MDLSVIILNYNTKSLTKQCLDFVFASKTKFQFEVIVSDNGSTDGSLEMIKTDFPQVKLIENGMNLGFSKGNNMAIQRSTGRHVLLLNSDTKVRPDTFEKMVAKADAEPNLGALGPKVLLANGMLDKASRRRFPNPANAFLRLFGMNKFSSYNIDSPIDKELEIDALTGACMLVPRKVIEKVGMLDEDYFFYGEDLDWCFVIKQAGYKIIYYPAAEITHLKAASSRAIPYKIVKVAYAAMKIFYEKHYAPRYPAVFNWVVYFGITSRMYLVMFLNLFRKNKSVH